ncbi:ABC transporter ATP-binding protein [Dietzia aurantiaca]|uniref:ABC transporter ATP-binding protein n=1 Tax=Dietzia aurantiaca TaxID=983873 RepID=UPI001E424D0E|nr:ABC transporter ATP-binding protein [Dietzia aurantiaca]MCD2262252.1 ABC transporter ATP-binding protein [Dietzia aurantiaca]
MSNGDSATTGLRVRGLAAAHRRRGDAVIAGIDLDLNPGEMVGVLGPNGCGKSTLLKTVCGVITPRSGTIVADGNDLVRVRPRHRAQILGYVPQHDDGVGRALTVAESMSLALDRRRLGEEAALDIVLGTAERLGLEGMTSRRAFELSGGQQQRVLIGRTLAARTPYLLLDEPVSALDLRYQLEIMQIVWDLVHTDRVGVLVVLHDLNLAAAFCDRLLVLDQGRVHSQGRPDDLITTEFVESLYGTVADVVDLDGARYVVPATRRNPEK